MIFPPFSGSSSPITNGRRSDREKYIVYSCSLLVQKQLSFGDAHVIVECVRRLYSARVPGSSLAGVHREFVHHILEDEVDGQEEGQDDKREDGEQREESGVVEESQKKHRSA